jgi:nitrate reductase delta subunit
MRTYQILGRLLAYPEEERIAALPEMRRLLAREGVLPAPHRDALDRLIAELQGTDLLDLQERYVALFDRTRSLALHLFEHVHGDSRDRGMAMVDLIEVYRKHGFEIATNELPDYLPLFLEFLAQLDPREAQSLLRDAAPVIAPIQARLAKRDSAYAAVLAALLHIAEAKPVAPASLPEEDDSLEALDAAWEEAAVTFGPGAPAQGESCSRAAAMLRRMEIS